MSNNKELQDLANRIAAAEQKEDSAPIQSSLGKDYGRASRTITRVVIEFAVPLGAGVWIGKWLDEKFTLSPWLTVIFALLGFGTGIMNIIRFVNKETSIQEDVDDMANRIDENV